MPVIHPTAIVHPKAQLADSVKVGPYAIIEENVTIDEGTVIESSNVIASGARIGKNCTIGHLTVVATLPQDLKFSGEETHCFIGDNTTLRECITINRGTSATRVTRIGANCFIMAFCHVAHDCTLGDNIILANAVQMGGHVSIGDFAIIGGVTVIHQFGNIGMHSMTGSRFRAMKDVPPYALAGKDPLTFEGLNSIGLRRRGFSRETIETLDRLYTILYRSGNNVSQAVEKIKAELPMIPEVVNVLDFIAKSKRGIIRG